MLLELRNYLYLNKSFPSWVFDKNLDNPIDVQYIPHETHNDCRRLPHPPLLNQTAFSNE